MDTTMQEPTKEVKEKSHTHHVATAKAPRDDYFKVPFSRMELAEGNIRTELGDIKGLAQSIKESGVKVALKGYTQKVDGVLKYFVVHGQRRFNAMKLLYEAEGLDIRAPFMMEERKINDEKRLFEMFLSNDGLPLTPLEQAEGYSKLTAYGYGAREIAAKLGKGQRWVEKLIKFNEIPEKLKKLVRRNRIKASTVIELQSKGPEAIEELLQKLDDGENIQDIMSADGEEMQELSLKKLSTKRAAVSKLDLSDGVNSMKELKLFLRNTDPDTLPEQGQETYKFLCRVMDNDMSHAAITRWFRKERD